MAIVMQAMTTDLSMPEGFDYMAELRYGGNGDLWAAPEYDAGRTTGDVESGRTTWDENILDGIDSGLQEVELYMDASGIRWTVGGQQIMYSPGTFNSIDQIKIIAGVDMQALFSWSDVEVKFYDDGNQIDSWADLDGPTVDQTGDPYASQLGEIFTITPEGTADAVRILASVRLGCPEGVYLGENSVFGQILISTQA